MAIKFIGERSPTARRSVTWLDQDPWPPESKYLIEESLDIFVLVKETEVIREYTKYRRTDGVSYKEDKHCKKSRG